MALPLYLRKEEVVVEKIINLLGEKGAGFFLVKAEREKKKVTDKIPKPANKVSCDDLRLEIEDATKKELEAKAQNIISSVNNEISSMWSEPFFRGTLHKKVMGLPVGERVAILPYIQKGAEETIYKMELDAWDKRAADVDMTIRNYESGFPKPFTLSMMNVDPDYPESRIEFIDNKPCDKWLREALGEKKPIPFDPYEKWGEKMSECYEKAYLPAWQRDQDLLHAPVAAKPEPPPPSPSNEQAKAIHGFFEQEAEDTGTLRGRVSRIYKGGK